MATPVLHWEWSKHTFSVSVKLDDVYAKIASDPYLGLATLGYTGIKYGTDLHADKGDFFIAVVYLQVSGKEFWRVVTCAGNGTLADAKTDINVVLGNIKILEENYF
jgi:hypothetical protein